ALVAATNIVSSAPRSSSEAKSTAYEIEIVEPCAAGGRLTFGAGATDEQTSSTRNMPGLLSEWGAFSAATIAPATQTATTYNRAATGRSFMSYGWGSWLNCTPAVPSSLSPHRQPPSG